MPKNNIGGKRTSKDTTWNRLKRIGRYTEDGIPQVQMDGEEAERYIQNIPFKEYDQTTQEQLDKEPIALVIYSNGQAYMNIYENRSQLMKSIKNEYGGFKQLGDSPKVIMNMNNEYFLTRRKYAKGGWVWEDANGRDVKGSQSRTFKKLQKYEAERRNS